MVRVGPVAGPMVETRKLSRCAIYTRKSTEHNLDLEFNSLDAQREACEAYIKSQAHEGWRLVPGEFNDGGISGASLDRPALQALISEIAAGKIDVVVVYKVDRLTRSLTDFAKLVDLFDKHGVSFVSITQSFNTTTSMGRLTLNVLLSFAQFEREVIGERVRDKIAASKRKGLWMGGPPPLGYASENKKLVIVQSEAETVREIFWRYLELGSIQALADDLDQRRIRTKKREWTDGRAVGGVRFGAGALAYLLKNRIYIGEIKHRGQVFGGDHEAIIGREQFDAVQDRIKSGVVRRSLKLKSTPSILTGKIFDEQGNRMTPSHTVKNGVRYRYYVSKGMPGEKGTTLRLPAVEIETLVERAIQSHSQIGQANNDDPNSLERVVVGPSEIQVHLQAAPDETDARILTVPWKSLRGSVIQGDAMDKNGEAGSRARNCEALLAAIAKARVWVAELTEDRASISEIAMREGNGERYIRLLLPLAFTAPAVMERISGSLSSVTLTQFATKISCSWRIQLDQV